MPIAKYIGTAIKIEKEGLNFYKKALSQVVDPNSRRLLELLIGEEEKHLKFFQSMAKDKHVDPGISKRQTSPLFKKKDYDKIKGSRAHTIHIFFTALEMEEKGIAFYMQTAKQVKDAETRKLLLKLADTEREHFKLIKQHQDALYNSWYWEAMEQPRFES